MNIFTYKEILKYPDWLNDLHSSKAWQQGTTKKERGLLEWCIQLGKLNKGPQIVLCAKSITSFVYSLNVALYCTEGHACSS